MPPPAPPPALLSSQETYRLEDTVQSQQKEVSQLETELAVQQAQNVALEKRLEALEGK